MFTSWSSKARVRLRLYSVFWTARLTALTIRLTIFEVAVMSGPTTSKKFKIPTLDEMDQREEEEQHSLFKKLKGASNENTKEMFSAPGNEKEIRNQVQPLALRDEKQLDAPNRIFSADTNTESGQDLEIVQNRPPNAKTMSSNSLIVNTRQRGNPILKSVRNIPWEYGNIVPDYVMGPSNCALFLSLRYHQLHPNYIHERLKQLGKSYTLRVLLVQVDVKESHHLLKDLAKICLLADCTLILAFSPEEAGRYLETYKIFENKPPEAIMEKTEENFMAKFTDCLTKVKSVNKTDCITLISQFKNLARVMEASEEDLSLCPGFGPQKAKRLHDIFNEPFLRSTHKRPT